MMRAPAVSAAALALGACSGASSGGNAAVDATPTPAATTPAMPTATTAAVTTPRPGAVKTFRDWAVACDNAGRCTMASLGPEAGDFPAYTLEVARAAGPTGDWDVSLATQREAGALPTALVIDGRRLPFRGDGLSGAGAARIAGALANGRTLAVQDDSGAQLATVSLAGASAALRFIDAEQGRAGGVTAMVARGPDPASAVPVAPAVPTLAIRPIGATSGKATAAQAARMRKIARCDNPPQGVDWSPDLHPLGDGRTLAIVPCSAGAYNVIGALFVIEGDAISPAQVDAPAGFEETGADSGTPVHSVINGAVDAGQLSSWAKGRGLGDCGLAQSFAWDGTRLRLTEQREMPECRGNPAPLRTWTVRTTRP